MRGHQSGADLAFQIGDGAQRDVGAEQVAGQLFDVAFAQAEVAGQIRQRRRQPRADAVGANLGGERRLVDLAATRTGARVRLKLGDHGHDGRQFDGLKALGRRIGRPGVARQGRLTLRAALG